MGAFWILVEEVLGRGIGLSSLAAGFQSLHAQNRGFSCELARRMTRVVRAKHKLKTGGP